MKEDPPDGESALERRRLKDRPVIGFGPGNIMAGSPPRPTILERADESN